MIQPSIFSGYVKFVSRRAKFTRKIMGLGIKMHFLLNMAMSSIYQHPYLDSMGYVKFHGGSQIGSSTQRDEEKHSKICETIIFQSQIRLFHAQIC